ncbi:hypothetical protein CDL15_Pgr014522 [Punica granatum]|uniref:Uncharacterized protein n=1 Tax=Punica granatum TaxID=22663 RepID=A0A218WEC1_PUNGR|nr:hypothetical protein CDL15_Pgr014522 [Punica granatum]PKI69705.1 hypothetical protein CRG98_009861 [Punica granatum]
MGPCRSYERKRHAFYPYEEEGNISDQDQEAAGNEEPPPPEAKKLQRDPVVEEIKGALRYINPHYSEKEIENILKYALKSENIMRIVFSCAKQYGYAAKSW